MGKVQEHERQLLDRLKAVGRLSLTDAVNLLKVSESTVRRLFIRLEKDGHVIRNYGGVQYFSEPNMNYSFEQLEGRNVAQKQAIAAYAVLLVENNDTIYIDSGTTLSHFSALLNARIETDALQNVTIFTNSLMNLNTLAKAGAPASDWWRVPPKPERFLRLSDRGNLKIPALYKMLSGERWLSS